MVSRYIFALNSNRIFLEFWRVLIDFEFNKRPLFGVHRYDLTDADENDIWLGISNTGISIYDKDYEIQLTLFNFRCIMEVSYRLLHILSKICFIIRVNSVGIVFFIIRYFGRNLL